MITIDGVLQKLERVKKSGEGHVALCPNHPDREPSLSVTEKNGRFLFHCFAGCSLDDILRALNLTKEEVTPSVGPMATYPYTDEAGKLLYEVLRYEPKSFKQRVPDGAGGWIWKLGTARRVLYRLPEVLKAETVLLVEGEKDADTGVNSLGFTATSMGAAAAKWTPEFTAMVNDKHCIIIPDKDEPGRKKASTVADAIKGTARSVRILEMSGESVKDLTDWHKAGGTREQLQQLISAASLYGATNGFHSHVELQLVEDVMEESQFWLWPNRIPLAKLSVIMGMPDVGKSVVSLDIVTRASLGAAWPDAPNPHPPMECLLFIAEDDLRDTVKPRLMVAGADLARVHCAIQTKITHKDKKEERRIAFDVDLALIEAVLRGKPQIKLIVIDPLGSYLGKLKKNSSEDLRWILCELKEMAERNNVTVISIDHFNKNSEQAGLHRLSGAGALAEVPRAVWAILKDPDDETRKTRLMLNAKLNVVEEAKKEGLKFQAHGVDLTIHGNKASYPTIVWLGAATGKDLDESLQRSKDPESGKKKKCITWLKEKLANGPRYSRDIYKEALGELGAGEKTVRNAVSELGSTVKVVKMTGGWQMELVK